MSLTAGMPVTPRSGPRRPRGRLWREIKRHKWNYVFVAPMLVLFLAFTAWPSVASWFYSLFNWDGYEPVTDFVGLANYREAVADPQFWNAAWHSLLFSLTAIFIELPLALVLAVVLNNRGLSGRTLFRLLLFLPVVTTTAVVGIVFKVMLNPVNGPVNEALTSAGLVGGPVNFLGDSSLALPTLLVISVWKTMGICLVYWMAALQLVPEDVYDAAKIDGARARTVLVRITLPIIAPLALVILLLTFRRSLNPFDLVQSMTEGGPQNATSVIATYLYDYAFNPQFFTPRFGYASAVGVLFGVAVLVITVLTAWVLRRSRRNDEVSR